MSAPTTGTRSDATAEVAPCNEVRLVGRLSQDPEERVLPSGDSVWTFRVVVPRRRGGKSRQRVDALECAAWSARSRRAVSSWSADDVVEVVGALHRRFFRAGGAVASRVEVEMTSGRVIRRAATG
ncbi:MAG TPA: single-stranded DNA-binding protein [Nocardioides sp.]|nr:single-stranded DNA-binding protein [Nocardioides sp.]